MKRVAVHLPMSVLEEMEREAERTYPDESGGVLLGHRDIADPNSLQVLHQVGPGPKAIHKPYRFEPDSTWQAARIASAYSKSGRIATYLGDWHSHPRGSSKPSSLDNSTANEISKFAEARALHPLMLILYGQPRSWDIAVYRRRRWRLRVGDVTVTGAINSR
jgi:integrative and conjugative element protein (TIGR02256 family)